MHTTLAPTAAPASVDVPTVLSEAAGYLELHGWCQGNLYGRSDTTEPRACAAGALAVIVYGTPINPRLRDDPRNAVIDHASQAVLHWLGIPARLDDAFSELIEWNDTPRRTPAQVIDTFRAVADELRRTA